MRCLWITTKKLIEKAKGSRCKVCQDYITESEADSCEFQASKTSRGGFNFVHTKCWTGEAREVKQT
jgi:hypothetical protein